MDWSRAPQDSDSDVKYVFFGGHFRSEWFRSDITRRSGRMTTASVEGPEGSRTTFKFGPRMFRHRDWLPSRFAPGKPTNYRISSGTAHTTARTSIFVRSWLDNQPAVGVGRWSVKYDTIIPYNNICGEPSTDSGYNHLVLSHLLETKKKNHQSNRCFFDPKFSYYVFTCLHMSSHVFKYEVEKVRFSLPTPVYGPLSMIHTNTYDPISTFREFWAVRMHPCDRYISSNRETENLCAKIPSPSYTFQCNAVDPTLRVHTRMAFIHVLNLTCSHATYVIV